MSSYVTRAGKGSALTHGELDDRAIIVAQTKAGAYTVVESDNRDTIEVSATATITLPDAATIAAASDTGDFQVTIKNLSGTTTIARTTGADTIDGTAADITLIDFRSVTFKVNQAGDGYNILADTSFLGGAVTSTAAELNIIDGDTAATSTTVISADRVVFNDNGTMVQVAVTDLDTYFNPNKGALVYKSANQSIATATYTHLSFDSENYDTNSIHDNATNNQRLTVPSGVTKIKLFGQVVFPSNATGERQAGVSKNDETTTPTVPVGVPVSKIDAAGGSSATFLNISSPVITVVAGDYFTLWVQQTSGGNLNVAVATTGYTYFAMEIIK